MGTVDSQTPFNLTALDRQLLAMTDEEFEAHDWENLRDIIGEKHFSSSPIFPSHPQPGMI